MSESTHVERAPKAAPRVRLRSDPNLVGNLDGDQGSVARAKRYIEQKETERRGEESK